jgi:MFS family permease
MLCGLALMATASVAFAFSETATVLVTARFLQGVGGALSWAGGMAWLLVTAPVERRGNLIGSALAAAIAGVMLGPVIGGLATVAGSEPVFLGVALVGGGLFAWAVGTPGAARSPVAGWRRVAKAAAGPTVVAGIWLVTLPALFSGTLNVLAPLKLDQLGASGLAVGAVFLVAAAVEAVLARQAGVLSDRRGRLAPIRLGLLLVTPVALLLPRAESAALEGVLVVAAVAALAAFWAPAMALLSDSAEAAGLDLAIAMAFTNLAWAGGQVLGAGGGSRLADATADAVPYAVLAALCLATLLITTSVFRRRSPVVGHATAEPRR